MKVKKVWHQNKSSKWTLIASGMLIGLCVILGSSVFAQANLEYQKRANRYEGTRPKPVSGFDIELLSAHIAYQDTANTMGDRYQVRFFLNEIHPVHLLVRVLDPVSKRIYYWLDKVEPESPWQAGFANVYSWPTTDVIRHLNGLSLYDLGAVARLDYSEPRAEEYVAPVLLYQSNHPAVVSGYEFVFKLREAAKIKGAIYRESDTHPIYERNLGERPGNRPFVFHWNLSDSPATEGTYKLVLEGYMIGNNNPVAQVVHFYHRPQVQ